MPLKQKWSLDLKGIYLRSKESVQRNTKNKIIRNLSTLEKVIVFKYMEIVLQMPLPFIVTYLMRLRMSRKSYFEIQVHAQ